MSTIVEDQMPSTSKASAPPRRGRRPIIGNDESRPSKNMKSSIIRSSPRAKKVSRNTEDKENASKEVSELPPTKVMKRGRKKAVQIASIQKSDEITLDESVDMTKAKTHGRKKQTGNDSLLMGDLKCDLCERTFSNTSGFKRHLKFCEDADGPPVVVKIPIIVANTFEGETIVPDLLPNEDDPDPDDPLEDLGNESDVNEDDTSTLKNQMKGVLLNKVNELIDETTSANDGKCHCCGEDLETAHQDGNFECPLCYKVFKLKSSLERHKRVMHLEGQTLECPECGARCPDKGTLARHMYTHTGLKPYTCTRCNKQFSRKYHLERHIVQTGCDGAPKPSYPCQVCGRMFTRKDNLREHLRAHAGQVKRKKRFSCEFCHKEFHGYSLLQIHVRTHTGERPFTCEFCNKGFPSCGAMKKHRRMHTGERPYECKECFAKFAAKETLNRHIKTHTGVKPHVCQFCGKSFIQATQLRAHIFHHTGENGFTCNHCGKAFNRRARLHMHVKFVHEGGKPFECDQCPKTFVRKEDLSRHSILHTGVKSHKCPICEKAFAMKSSLKIHLLTHTKEPPRACDECGRAFIRQDCLLRHMRTKHRDMLEEIMAEAEKKKLQQQLLAATAATGVGSPEVLGESTLADSVRELLTLLVDETTLRAFGWPDAPVDRLLEAVIRRCGHQPVSQDDYAYIDRLRENAKLLFTVVIDDSAVKTLLNNQTVDEVILHVLRLAKS